jgi:hypothetical protein
MIKEVKAGLCYADPYGSLYRVEKIQEGIVTFKDEEGKPKRVKVNDMINVFRKDNVYVVEKHSKK